MAVKGSGLSPELLLAGDRRGGGIRGQLGALLRGTIRSRRPRPGGRRASCRGAGRARGGCPGVVQDCFAQLQAEGYLTSQVGSATRVAGTMGPARAAPSAPSPPRASAGNGLLADFRSGVPDLASFPRTDWMWALREANRVMQN